MNNAKLSWNVRLAKYSSLRLLSQLKGSLGSLAVNQRQSLNDYFLSKENHLGQKQQLLNNNNKRQR